MQVDVEEILEPRSADSRGRVRIGTEYAGQEVRVAIVEVLDDSNTEEYPQPSACAECGQAVQDFVLKDGTALCFECAGVDRDEALPN